MGDIAHQLGFADQVTNYQTATTVNRFVEFTSETLERRNTIAQSEGIRSGRRYGGQGRRITRQDAAGTVTTEVATSGFGLWFEHLLGGVASATPEAGVHVHTFTPGSLLSKNLTVQKGVEKPDGTVQAFTYIGGKIVSVDLSIDQDGLLMADWEFDFRNEVTNIALAAASYTTPAVYTYSEGTLSIDSAVKANVRSVGSLKITNNLLTERFFLGSSGFKSEPINVPFDQITGSLDVEFQNLTDFYDLFAADTSAELDLEFTGGLIAPGQNYEFTVNLADVRFEGETPKIGGPELVYQNIPFVALDPAAGAAVTIVYKTDTAAP